MIIQDFANAAAPSTRVGLLTGFFAEEDLEAPVDMYLSTARSMLNYGTEERLKENLFIGRLLFVGVISAAEAYFRGVLSSCMEICPVCRRAASQNAKQIHLGGLLWHGREGYSRSAFEHHSFTSKAELAKAVHDFLGVKLEDGVFKALLEEYDIVCQLRHGVVHCDGLLPGRNAVQLDIPRYQRPVRTVLGFEQLQTLGAVVGNLVLAFNRELFEVMTRRWAIEWRQRLDWISSEEDELFSRLWSIFHSLIDFGHDSKSSEAMRLDCISAVRAQYNL